MKNNRLTLILVLIISISGYSQNFEQEFDFLLSKDYPTSGTGASALVAVNGNVIYKKAFGKANLELGVDMSVNSVFEIGSISKNTLIHSSLYQVFLPVRTSLQNLHSICSITVFFVIVLK